MWCLGRYKTDGGCGIEGVHFGWKEVREEMEALVQIFLVKMLIFYVEV